VLPLFLIAAGVGGLIAGAELLIRSSLRIATAIGVSPLIIGLTLVAFGTSSPEMAVTVFATLRNQGDIALGNVIGSNIFNILFILGVGAVIAPLAINRELLRVHLPVLVGVSLLAWILAANGQYGRVEGTILVGAILLYTGAAIRRGRQQEAREPVAAGSVAAAAAAERRTALTWTLDLAGTVAGLALLVLGSSWLVSGASEMARLLGVSELVIGLTIVAGGTSLPEVATSVLAAIRGRSDVAVGNVVGSNIFNLLAILGAAALIAPAGVPVPPHALRFDIPLMVAAAALCIPVFLTAHRVDRAEGALFLAGYVGYVLLLIARV
jgi:cation:H+ antiporter